MHNAVQSLALIISIGMNSLHLQKGASPVGKPAIQHVKEKLQVMSQKEEDILGDSPIHSHILEETDISTAKL